MKTSAVLIEGAKIAGLVAVGYLTIRLVQKMREGLDKGSTIVQSAGAAIASVVTQDLNPASDQNIVYRAATAATSAFTGREESPGTYLAGLFEGKSNAAIDAMKKGAAVSDLTKQAEVMEAQQDAFRRSEITAQNQQQAAADYADAQMSRNKANFRVSEVIRQNDPQYKSTSFDELLNNLAAKIRQI